MGIRKNHKKALELYIYALKLGYKKAEVKIKELKETQSQRGNSPSQTYLEDTIKDLVKECISDIVSEAVDKFVDEDGTIISEVAGAIAAEVIVGGVLSNVEFSYI